ncbi:MAG: hypothetical protein JWN44_4436 [Myxococcales bacterium]|nr:hypothetical protein [Myxococcales bacterium]
MNSALYGLVVYGVGCVIPTPLDQTQQTPNYSPVFVTSQVQPRFGPLGPLSQSQLLSITMVASDANLDDTLQARLFELINGTLVATGQTTTLNPIVPAGDDATLRLGGFELALCAGKAPASIHYIYAVVADRGFQSPTSSVVSGNGLSDTNHWELSCM